MELNIAIGNIIAGILAIVLIIAAFILAYDGVRAFLKYLPEKAAQEKAKEAEMKTKISILLMSFGVILAIGGGYWIYDTKYHRLFWSASQELEAMIPGIIIAVIGALGIIIGIVLFLAKAQER